MDAGIENFTAATYPAVIIPTLLLRFDFSPEEIGAVQLLRATADHEDGERLTDLTLGFEYHPRGEVDPRLALFYVVSQTLPLQIRRDGLYSINVSLNGENVARLPFVTQSQMSAP